MARKIIVDSRICGGCPTLEGTRLTCGDIVSLVSELGMDEFMRIHFYLAPEDVHVGLRYAAQKVCISDGVQERCRACLASDAGSEAASVWTKARELSDAHKSIDAKA